MGRPATIHVGGATYWVMRLYDPTDGVTLKDADSTPTVAVRRNGSSTGDSVTVSKRSATTGIYDCSVTVGSTAEGDSVTFEESAVIDGVTYQWNWEATVHADMVSAPTSAADIWMYGSRTITAVNSDAIDSDSLDATALAAISTQVAADLQTAHGAGSWQTATGFSTHSAADVRAEMDSNSTQLAAIVEDTGTTLPGTLTTINSAITTIDGIVDAILLDTAEIGAAGSGLTEAGGTGDQLTAITGIILDAAGIRSAIGMAAADLDTQLDAIAGSAGGLDAAGVRAAVGLASANLDTQLGVITADTNELQTDWADGGRLDTLLDTAASGGGGDATEAKQDQIIGLISSGTITSNSPVDPNTNTVTIIRNATYDGTARPTLAFTVSKDYTGWTGTFTVNHRDTGVELISASVTVTSSTLLNVTLAAADTALTALLDDEEFGRHPYDIQMTSGSSNDVLGPYIAQLVKDVKG